MSGNANSSTARKASMELASVFHDKTGGDTTWRTRFACGAREWNNRWCECGPTHHFAAAQGSWTTTIEKVAKILDVPVQVVR